jgi:diaminopimelate decarboxylase
VYLAHADMIDLNFFDIGGGFFGKMSPTLARQFGRPIPGFAEYASAIVPVLLEAFSSLDAPRLILEPGTAITSNVMKFVTRIVDMKEIRGKRFATAAASIYNIKPTLNDKNLPVTCYRPDSAPTDVVNPTPLDVTGYTCMERDFLYKGYDGPLAAGDYLVFDNVGAYTNVLKPPFIHPNRPILLFENGQPGPVIKRREHFDDVFATYTF